MTTVPVEGAGIQADRLGMLKLYTVLVATVAGVIVGLNNNSILPARFFFDSDRIFLFSKVQTATREGSYSGTATLYKMSLLSNLSVHGVGLVTFALFVLCVFLYNSPSTLAESPWPRVLLVCSAILLAGIYLFMYTKEVFILLLVILFYFASHSFPGLMVWAVPVAAYAIYVRQYWLIVLALFFFFSLLIRARAARRWFIWAIPAASLVVVLAFNYILGVTASYYRTSVLDDITATPDSAIVLPFDGISIVSQYLNSLYGLVILVLPFPLAVSGAPHQLLAMLLVAILWGRFWRCFDVTVTVDNRTSFRIGASTALCVAYLITLSTFEPDYGSYLRHLLPVIPIVVAVGSQPRPRTRRARTT